jgi:hypothetical protein
MEKPQYKIQSILIDRHKYSVEEACKWLFANGFEVKKIDGTKNLWRFRQYNPATLRTQGYNHYAHKQIADGISFVLAYKS